MFFGYDNVSIKTATFEKIAKSTGREENRIYRAVINIKKRDWTPKIISSPPPAVKTQRRRFLRQGRRQWVSDGGL